MHNLNLTLLFIVFCLLFFVSADAQSSSVDYPGASSGDAVTNFKPSLAVIVGILALMFIVTFLLLIYAKFCYRGSSSRRDSLSIRRGLFRSTSGLSGIDKKVIESLPFFRFSSLKGTREGLECAVCLAKFEDVEILRVLPKCRHAFHISCIDQWLEKHSSCPLCRDRISVDDPTVLAYSESLRFLWEQSEGRADSDLQVFVEREENLPSGSSGRFFRSSFRKGKKGEKEDAILIQTNDVLTGEDYANERILHKFNHKIVLSDVVFKNRWSNVSSSDMIFLNSEMLDVISSDRFSDPGSENKATESKEEQKNDGIRIEIKDDEVEMKRMFDKKEHNESRILNQTQKRAMSDITDVSRFHNLHDKDTDRLSSDVPGNFDVEGERTRRLWFPIARRTVQWFVNREKRPQRDEENSSTKMQKSTSDS